ncbi:hypothetical protein Ancab_006680, partial [Ancistrocladus abbreviatus]
QQMVFNVSLRPVDPLHLIECSPFTFNSEVGSPCCGPGFLRLSDSEVLRFGFSV